MQHTSFKRALAALAGGFVILSLSSFGHATVLVNDTWIDGTDTDPASPVYSEAGSDSDSDGDLESAWFKGGDGTLDPVAAGGPLRGRFSSPTSVSSASWTTYFTAEGSEVDLANAGDMLKITWKFTPTNVNTSNASQNFRLAVVDSPAGSRVTSDATPGNATYTGYAMFMNMGQTLGHSRSFELMERAAPGTASALLSASGSWTGMGPVNGATTGEDGYDSGAEYTFLMTIIRNLSGGLDIEASMTGPGIGNDGQISVSTTDATPNGGSYKFDTFAVRPSGATTTAEIFDTSLFKVEFIPIPEPASLALLALSGLVLIRRR